MSGATDREQIFVALNPSSGQLPAERVREIISAVFNEHNVAFHIHELTPEDDLGKLVRAAIRKGSRMIVVAGGDGTVSMAANGMIYTPVPLAVIPTGTANVLARELEIPLDPEAACRLIVSPHDCRTIDAMYIGDRYAVLQIGIGLGSLMIRDTSRQAKRLIGRAAYMLTAVSRLFGYEPRRFTLSIDGRRVRTRGLHIVIANGATLGTHPLRWGPDIEPDDGTINVGVFQSRTLSDLLGIAWHVLLSRHRRSRNMRYYKVRNRVAIHANPALPVQVDGEIIGDTPVKVTVVPAAIRMLVPQHAASGNHE